MGAKFIDGMLQPESEEEVVERIQKRAAATVEHMFLSGDFDAGLSDLDEAAFEAIISNPAWRYSYAMSDLLWPHDAPHRPPNVMETVTSTEYRANVWGVYLDEFSQRIDIPFPSKVKGEAHIVIAEGSDGKYRAEYGYHFGLFGRGALPNVSSRALSIPSMVVGQAAERLQAAVHGDIGADHKHAEAIKAALADFVYKTTMHDYDPLTVEVINS